MSSSSSSSAFSSTESHLATAKTVLSTAASVAATIMVARSLLNDFLPSEILDFISAGTRRLFSRFSSQLTMVIDEFDGLVNNQIYEAAETYLATKVIAPSSSSSTSQQRRLKVSKSDTDKNFTLTIERGEGITDIFNSIKFHWVLISRHVESKNFHNPRDLNSTLRSEVRSLELTFNKKHKDTVLKTYLPFIIDEAKSMKQETKAMKIFMVDYQNMYGSPSDAWVGTNLDHPATFETVALERETKEFVMEDLKRFMKRREYYRKVGKAWKRGYLLYGPPGTGKSSLIAAMANYLNFDVYDLELTELDCNSDLRKLLIGMGNRSIVVVEDIDCTIEFHDRMAESEEDTGRRRNNKVTLSGLLNFVDGLWSSCGDERIIVFTTNHKDKLDPALLRPGRMDVHIHMSYCTPSGFRQLASNYLGISEHPLFGEIDERIRKTLVTPAEVAEQLIKSSNVETTLQGLVEFLDNKKETQELEAKKREQESKDKEVEKEEKRKEKDDEEKVD